MGTRVPVQAIFDYLEAGDSLNESLYDFPSVKWQQALELLKMANSHFTRVN